LVFSLDCQGIDFLAENGFIASKDPKDIATFLFQTDGLNKAMLGEYLGYERIPSSL